MSILQIMNKLADKLAKSNNGVFNVPVAYQKEYLNTLKTPKNDFDRSYNQYLCQMRLNSRWVSLGLNIVSIPMILFYLVKPNNSNAGISCKKNVFFCDGKPNNIIPKELSILLGDYITINEKKEALQKSDFAFFLEILRKHPFSFHFLLKCLLKIRFYSFQIQKYHPDIIVVCNEYSFTSSVMTEYCNRNGIQHINVMHGEKLFYMRDSFFHFNRCYVWDQVYAELFVALRADKEQFVIATPESFDFSKFDQIEIKYDYTYYLGYESGDTLQKIIFAMKTLRRKNYYVNIRPHPRYTDLNELRMYCGGDIDIENTHAVLIEESIMRSRSVISAYSTVLNQAYHNGRNVVIDDYSQPENYNKLFDLGYVMLEVKHEVLSEILNREGVLL